LKAGITPSGVFIGSADNTPPLKRSVTLPSTPKKVMNNLPPEPSGVTRSNTKLNLRIADSPTASGLPSATRPFERRNTAATSNRPSPASGVDGLGSEPSARKPLRGLDKQLPPLAAVEEQPVTRPFKSTKEEYHDSSNEGSAGPPLRSGGNSDIAAWARANARPPQTHSRSASARAASSSGSAPRVRRRVGSRRMQTRYEEEEEGYASGDYDDGPYELSKIRVKLHYQGDVRGMTLTSDMAWEEFMERVTTKFGRSMDDLLLKFKDEDGGHVTLRDESDYDLAIETARESANGKPDGKLEIWCQDV